MNNVDENWGWGDWYPEGVPLCAIDILGDNDEVTDEDICGMCCEDDEENHDPVQALSEPGETGEDDLSMADSEDVPGHVDSDSEEETEPEWVKEKKARPNPNMIMQAVWEKAEETDEINKKIVSGQPPRGQNEDWIRAHDRMKMMMNSGGNDGDISCSERSKKLQWSGKWLKGRWKVLEEEDHRSGEDRKPPQPEDPGHSNPAVITPPTQEEHGDDVPWQVKVKKDKSKGKLSANQRRAAARKPKTGCGNFAGVLEEEGMQPVCLAGQEWERIELTVDSGAAETICPASMACSIATTPGPKKAQGVNYTCAGGRRLPNLGEKKCMMSTSESRAIRGLTMQVADINRPLLSVAKAVDAGNRVIFDREWSYIEDCTTGERTTIQRQGGLYVLEAWVKGKSESDKNPAAPFGRQGGGR